jgi:hypothetical protein
MTSVDKFVFERKRVTITQTGLPLVANNNPPFIQPSTAREAFEESNKWFRPYFEPVEEFERLARNKPSPKIDPALPKITSGDLASDHPGRPKERHPAAGYRLSTQ